MDTEKLNLMNIVIEYIADLWARFFAPVSVDRVVEKNGRKVRVRVDEVKDEIKQGTIKENK